MRIDVITLFPGIFAGPLDESILARAREAGLVDVRVHDLRPFGLGRHRVCDDTTYGGGAGMVLRPEPIDAALESIVGPSSAPRPARIIHLSPQGALLDHARVERLSREPWLVLLCGRYEGVDQRALDLWADEEISVGDYVLTGGELPALTLIDAVVRLIPGVLGNADSARNDSFAQGILDCPHYTRP
ncbi:MAG: tRNA (guanosine(37)-N1)-methyltransferase TrmD, partial [Candidatus Sumerlaeota bacterium]|nr:tRNA (guanosine(37)-N1)-methyltransferase TrmD [Candidatus Sumerlaeota bacterium]